MGNDYSNGSMITSTASNNIQWVTGYQIQLQQHMPVFATPEPDEQPKSTRQRHADLAWLDRRVDELRVTL